MPSLDLNLALDAVRIKAEKEEADSRLRKAREEVEKAIFEFAAAAGMATAARPDGHVLMNRSIVLTW